MTNFDRCKWRQHESMPQSLTRGTKFEYIGRNQLESHAAEGCAKRIYRIPGCDKAVEGTPHRQPEAIHPGKFSTATPPIEYNLLPGLYFDWLSCILALGRSDELNQGLSLSRVCAPASRSWIPLREAHCLFSLCAVRISSNKPISHP